MSVLYCLEKLNGQSWDLQVKNIFSSGPSHLTCWPSSPSSRGESDRVSSVCWSSVCIAGSDHNSSGSVTGQPSASLYSSDLQPSLNLIFLLDKIFVNSVRNGNRLTTISDQKFQKIMHLQSNKNVKNRVSLLFNATYFSISQKPRSMDGVYEKYHYIAV